MEKESSLLKNIWQKIQFRFAGSIIFVNLFLLAEVLVVKKLMLQDSGSYNSFLDVIRVCGKELAIIISCTLVPITISAFLSSRICFSLKILHVLFALLFSITMIAQSILFRTTGIGINREYIQNFLHNPGEDLKMIFSQVRFTYWLGLFFISLVIIFLTMFPGTRQFDRLIQRFLNTSSKNTMKKVAIVVALIFIISLEALALLPGLESVHPAIRQVAFLELVEALAPEKNDDSIQAPVEILPEEQLDRPVVLVAGEDFRPFNVVLIIFESLSWKYCDIYQPGLGATPFLEELAKKGLVVERLYTVDPHTTKALVPIIAGIYPYPEPAVLEAKPEVIPKKALPHLLKGFGYRTAFFQTANNYEDRPGLVANLGYDLFRGLYHMPQEGFAYVNYFGREEMMMLKPSLGWVDETKDQPFLLTYLTLSTHHEYGYPPQFQARDFGVRNESLNRYLNAVRYTDNFIKKVIEEFQKRDLINKTIFIIVGDHGEAFGEHGLSGHNYTLWEEGLRVPGLIYAPGILKEPATIEGFRSTLDIVPTICELIGLELKEGDFMGRSLLSQQEDDRELFYTGWSRSRVLAYRKGKHKFIFPSWSPKAELYDNENDPYDENNILDIKNEYDADVEAYRKRTQHWFDSVAAQYRQWEKKSRSEFKSSQPEDFAKKTEARIDNLITIYGHGYFPEKTEPGRTIYVRVGIKCENRVKRPLQLKAILRSENSGSVAHFNLMPRLPLENLNPGDFSSAETIVAVPADWPLGRSKLYVGVLDEKRGLFLRPEGSGFEGTEEGLIYIGDLDLFSGEEKEK